MIFRFASVAIDMAQLLGLVFILLCYLGSSDPRSWIASSPLFLELFGDRSLSLRLISKRRRVVVLSFFFVPIGVLIELLSMDIVIVFFHPRLISF